MSACRSCGAEIVWTATEHGRRMPLDADPVDLVTLTSTGGLFALRWQGTKVIGYLLAIAATPDQLPGEALYRSHFATCPQAAAWRRGRD